jgi:cytochrome c-type biogenesis protein CcmH/NrfG
LELIKRLLGIRTDSMELARLGREAYGKGHPQLAELTLTQATKLSPDDPAVRVGLAEISYARGHDKDALDSYETAMRLDPTRPEPLVGVASALHRMGRPSEAVYYYLAYLGKRPDDIRALLSLAGVFQSTAQYDAAIDVLQRAERLEPDNPQVHRQYGQALYEMGRNAEGSGVARR